MTRVDAIVLAGGRATRMGGVDKPALRVGGATMLATALAATGECDRQVVVGPYRADLGPRIEQTREDPPNSGPVAAIAAGLRTLGADAAEIVVVLAADLPLLRVDTVRELIRRCAGSDRALACAVDAEGRAQYLVAAWRRDALAARFAAIGPTAGVSVKTLVRDDATLVALDEIGDCDTDADVRRVAAALPTGSLTLDVARDVLRRGLSPLPSRQRAIDDAIGAALAEPMRALDALPRFDGSAMDGYAVAGSGPWAIRADTSVAGGAEVTALTAGTAVRIATGARVPIGTTGVLRDEFTAVDDKLLHRAPDTPVRDDIRRRGEDWQPGDVLAPAGTPVGSALVSVAAAAGVGEIAVHGPVRARVFMTGDEIATGEPATARQTRDSLGPILGDFLSYCGIRCVAVDPVPDDADSFDHLMRTATDADVLIFVGATGAGAADQLRAALVRTSARIVVPRLRMRPGGSTVVAELADSRLVLGLPGNPFAAVAVLLTVGPALVDGRTHRSPRARPLTGRLANAGQVCGSVTRVLPARSLPDGGWLADAAVHTAHLGGLLGRDALAVVPPDISDDAIVELIHLRPFSGM